jgi:type II secretory ATPase GspE/PulE/Tfp pilus assembly ATPase PilB-like protein
MITMLQERNYETNLITVEDPPEYPIPGARQMPVTNASIEEAKDREFTKALSAALRSDPDSLMIGEIRTLPAADLAFRGALSGHNVWTTLHANTAAAVLLRLRDIGVENFKLEDPSIMRGMLAQRLFRRLCPHCRIQAKTQLDNPAVQRLQEAYGDIGVERAYLRGPGCEECDFHGVSGRTAVAEFILPDATFLDLMLKGESQKAMNYWISDLGGRTLRENAMDRLFSGILDIEEVERWTGLINQNATG